MSQSIKDKLIEIGLILDIQSQRIAVLEARLEALDGQVKQPKPLPPIRDPDEPWLQQPLLEG